MKKIAVLGLGKIGALAAQMLSDAGFEVHGFDLHPPREDMLFATHTLGEHGRSRRHVCHIPAG